MKKQFNQEWHQDDKLWETFYDCMFNEQRFKEAEQEVTQLQQLINIDGKQVLDLGCGPGRHALIFAKLGFDVTAIDTSNYLLDIARKNVLDKQLSIEFKQQDMRDIEYDGQFDLVTSLFTSFGYFDDVNDDLWVLENAFSSLKASGVLIIDMVGKEYLLQNLEPVHLREFDNGDLLIERPVLIDEMNRLHNEWILINKKDQAHRIRFALNIYTGEEIRQKLMHVGFNHVELYGNFAGDPYDLNSERLVAVAYKGE